MRKALVVSSVLTASLLLWGCGKETPTTEKAAAPTETKTVTEKSAVDSAMKVADKELEKMTEAATEMADSAVQQAKELIEQAIEYINEGRLDLAEEAIAQLEGIEEALPDSVKSQIENLKQLFAAKQTTDETMKKAESVQGMMPGQSK